MTRDLSSTSPSTGLAVGLRAGLRVGLFAGLAAGAMAQQFPLGDATPLTFQLTRTRQPTPGDFNGDGLVDVLVSSSNIAGISMLAGIGQASFGAPVPIGNLDRIVLDFAAADLDGDGDIDVAALLDGDAGGPKRLVRLLSDGAANFTATTILDGATAYRSLEVADLTGDGAMDLVLARAAGSGYEVVFLEAQGSGYAPPSGSIASSFRGFLGGFRTVDVDGDGVPDITTDANRQSELAFARGLGGGTFAPGIPIQASDGTIIKFPSKFEDIDGDGDIDCLSDVDEADTLVRYYDGIGSGAFAAPATIGSLTEQGSLQLLDADSDDDLDIANVQLSGTAPFFFPQPTIFLQTTPGNFGPGITTFAELSPGSVVVDIDSNGRDDIIDGDGSSTSPLTWQLNDQAASNGFFGAINSAPTSPFFNIRRRAVGDIDGDGDDDVIVTTSNNSTSGTVGWIENVAPGTTAPAVALFPTSTNLGTPYILDVDGDSDADLVIESSNASGGASEFWINDGNMSFTLASTLTALGSGPQRTFHVEDMDGDGDADVVIGKATNALSDLEVRYYTNTGTATAFMQYGIIFGPANVVDLEVGEFNGDNLRDLVTMNTTGIPGQTRMEVYLGLPGSRFSDPIAVPGVLQTRNVSVGDFDSDGLTDLFVWDGPNGIILRRALGGGTFEAPLQVVNAQTTSSSFPVYPLDFDGDGDTDILYPLITSSASALSIAEQLPGGVMRDGFPASANGPFGVSIQPPALADLDGDGDGELIIVELGNVNAYENLGIVNVGSAFCTGLDILGATLSAVGTETLSDNRITLVAAGVQADIFGIAVGSRTFGPPMPVAGSQGTICLTGAIGRYDGPGQVLNSGAAGLLSLDLDLGALETPAGSIPGQVGESWSFQLWYRSSSGSVQTSRFTTGVTVQLR